MISIEQIAHDLAIIYLKNRYGIDVSGSVSLSKGDGYGDISTLHLPSTSQSKYKKIGTGEKGFLGIEKKIKVEDGLEVDDLFNEIVDEYMNAYNHFHLLLSQKQF